MCDVDHNGPLPKVQWTTKDLTLHAHHEVGDVSKCLSRLDCFQLMFLPQAMHHIVTLTNVGLAEKEWDDCDIREMTSFFGLIPLGAQFQFANHHNLWPNELLSKFIIAPAFWQFQCVLQLV